MQHTCHVSEDWPHVVLSGLERCVEKRVEYEKAKEYLVLFENACSRKNVFDLEEEEFSGRLKRLQESSCSILSDDSQDASIRSVCIEILQSYMTYGRDWEVASSFEEVSTGCLSFLKQRKKDGVYETSVGWQLLERGIMRMHSMSDNVQMTRGAAGVVSKVGNMCVQMLDVDVCTLGVLGCLGACLIGFPSSLKHVEKALEEKVGALLMKGGECKHASAVVFAMLPRISGCGDVWSRCSQRLLVSIHTILNTLLDGLGPDRNDQNVYIDTSVEPLSQCGDGKSQMIVFTEYVENVQGLMDSLTSLISNSFQVPVPMPIHGILALCRRLMKIDVTRIRNIERAGRTAGQVAILGIHISSLQTHALRMLLNLMRVCQGGLIIPHIYSINSIFVGYLDSVSMLWEHDSDISDESVFRLVLQCVKESIRIDGIAGTEAFSKLIMGFATSTISPYLKSTQEELLIKKSAKTYFMRHEYAGRMLLVAMTCHADILRVIEAMFASSALQGEERFYMEDFVLHVANTSYQLVEHTSLHIKGDITRISIVLQSALAALAAAVAAPSVYRPVHAAEALALFRKAMSLSTMDIRSVCRRAISHLELSMHPKSLLAPLDTESRARGTHGMPSYWSFLDYDGTPRQTVQTSEDDNNKEETEKQEEDTPQAMMNAARETPVHETVNNKRRMERLEDSGPVPLPKKRPQGPPIEFKIPSIDEGAAKQPSKPLPSQDNSHRLNVQQDDDSDSDVLPEIDSGGEES